MPNVSGMIQALYCDVNTKVRAGQLCAKIDPRPYKAAVDQEKAVLVEAEARHEKYKAELTAITVQLGLDDGNYTEIVKGDVQSGDELIISEDGGMRR
ncbi:MAG: hypothetical protein USCAAHI_02301 [Beijerinckiaceae bacterium]|nr:MAG: hypothetical protein USCAAHI_02301 [Beijerinckiaceae bacterium]